MGIIQRRRIKNIISFYVAWLIFVLTMVTNLFALDYVPNEAIVKLINFQSKESNNFNLTELDNFLNNRSPKNIKSIDNKTESQFFVITFNNNNDRDNFLNSKFPGVEYIQPNYLSSFWLDSNDPLFYEQQADFSNTKINKAWDSTIGHSGIIVSVIDSGIYFEHPDLQNNIWHNPDEIPNNGIDDDNNGYIDDWRGWDFVDAPELESIALPGSDFINQDNDPSDELMHGTHVSGIIAADTNNSEGIAGICWTTKIMPLRAGFSIAGAS
ncbi:MAG: S8 family serine peptidase, partial [Candidatus Cloacimonetes bacterium]|nr:S8 family serine peptidase [Candidatus Cloacimonadota bacterium]